MGISRNTMSKYLMRSEKFGKGNIRKIIHRKSNNYFRISDKVAIRIDKLPEDNDSKPVK
ncbi:MAG: hypothetical protein IEMM0003_0774 [bacterium]|nr:MAG: hypothetical protein IEMM0003_0774 [bacterium]